MFKTAGLLATAIAGIGLTSAAHADTPSRLDRIKQTGTLSVGYPTSSLPFAYLDNAHQPVGYSVEICQRIADHLKKDLALPEIKIRYVPVTSATRLPLLQNGTIDLECGNTTNTVERHKLVSFSPTTFVTKVVLMARKDSNLDVNSPAAFAGKTVTSLAGGLDLQIIQQISNQQHLNISVLPVNDTAASFIAVKTGRAMAVSTDDGLAYALVATSGAPQDYTIGTKAMLLAPYGIVEPKDDARFKQAVDNAVLDLMKTKQIVPLYEKWFNSPVPPAGVNLKYPMSAELKHAIEHPSDSGDPAAYTVNP
ncbi:amino acid ABC transporter substrate-binding protein [Paraburkholderia sp. FT54]|uniref:amino acid ABC transporter substrate-binding protein n=1 Tax=Paraburkholderia sp. FT54 TaxID=3074437 RepID=UPI002877433D|nr:amino acid ABC transporter substrate-binding protein [Paraburkholderia sp. FT54]WNC94785.1 amino acid ABC transporter substrate-binding protein [Paraburkholderia sp. FT54]